MQQDKMLTVNIEESIRCIAPEYVPGIVRATVKNAPTPNALWDEIEKQSGSLREKYDTASIKERNGILATRIAYKKSGVDPSRYRPSCEQLCRRILQGKELYRIDSLVDIGNLLSMFCGYSVAMLDRNKIVGNEISFGIGRIDDPYEAIGRGQLNISGMPVWRDSAGPFATPTSDNVRTMCTLETNEILVIINAFDGDKENLGKSIDLLHSLLERFAACTNFVRIEN